MQPRRPVALSQAEVQKRQWGLAVCFRAVGLADVSEFVSWEWKTSYMNCAIAAFGGQ
jgi:hypothetical protein